MDLSSAVLSTLQPQRSRAAARGPVHARAAAQTAERSSTRPAERQARPENVPGSFYVDHTCIDCDACRWIAPSTFNRQNEQSAVHAQPASHAERVRALQALITCPTFSIHSSEKAELKEAVAGLPEPIESAPGAYYCGFNSKDSYGGNGYLLQRPGGNVLVDSPRFTPQLLRNIQALGGAEFIFLTHQDDVADHAKWASALGCKRVMHRGECNAAQGTDQCEVQLEGEGPWRLPDGGEDVELIWTPGHTQYHVVLYYAPSKVLFTGDHLSGQRENQGQLRISPDYNWFSFPEQKRSVEKLLAWDWLTVLPGHGRRAWVKDAEDRLKQVSLCLSRHS